MQPLRHIYIATVNNPNSKRYGIGYAILDDNGKTLETHNERISTSKRPSDSYLAAITATKALKSLAACDEVVIHCSDATLGSLIADKHFRDSLSESATQGYIHRAYDAFLSAAQSYNAVSTHHKAEGADAGMALALSEAQAGAKKVFKDKKARPKRKHRMTTAGAMDEYDDFDL